MKTTITLFLLSFFFISCNNVFPGSCNWTCLNVSNPYQTGEYYASVHTGRVPDDKDCVGNGGGSHNWSKECADPVGGN